jgi:formyl-CoA transferase
VSATLPLAGITVIDLTQAMAGPAATQILGDFGAEVIKIERPKTGDLARESVFDDFDLDNAVFASMNRNKRSIVLDLRNPDGVGVVKRLVENADVIVSNYRPQTMDRLGLGYDELTALNPRLIFASASTFGPTGPHAMEPGMDSTAQAASGVVMRRADPSHPVALYGTAVADYAAAMNLTHGILLALIARDKTGKGQRVDVSLFDAMLSMQMQEGTSLLTREVTLNWANRPLNAIFETADRPLVLVGAFRAEPLRDLCAALEMEDLSLIERFSTQRGMDENITELRGLLQDRLRTQPREHWLEKLREADFLSAPVNDLAEALADPQTAHNDMVWSITRDSGESMHVIATPIKLSDTPATVRSVPPRLGENSKEILAEAGFDPVETARLEGDGVLG